MQSQPGSGTVHQRSKSNLSPPTSHMIIASNQNLHPQPQGHMLTSTPMADDPAKHMYGSTSFIYRLISSTGPGESPTLPACAPGTVAQYQQLYLPHQQRASPQHPTFSHQQVVHQRSKSHATPQDQQPQLPPAPHARSHSHLLSAPTDPPAPPPPHRTNLSRSSSQLHRATPPQQRAGSSTLAPQHRREGSHPSTRHHPPPNPLHYSPHQRSKSTPYHGFVV